jgi:DNA-nicking Smr family endonuclease
MPRRRPTAPPLDPRDRMLWEKVAEQAKPLRRHPQASAEIQPQPEAPRGTKRQTPAPPRKAEPAVAPNPPPPGAIDRRLTQRLGRGLRPVEARIDLHGMRQGEAQEALYDFLARSQARGFGLVLAITGKGSVTAREEAGFMPDRDIGILRRALPQWLGLPRFRPLVVGFTPAHRRHGGEGAVYVQIRRAAKSKIRE